MEDKNILTSFLINGKTADGVHLVFILQLFSIFPENKRSFHQSKNLVEERFDHQNMRGNICFYSQTSLSTSTLHFYKEPAWSSPPSSSLSSVSGALLSQSLKKRFQIRLKTVKYIICARESDNFTWTHCILQIKATWEWQVAHKSKWSQIIINQTLDLVVFTHHPQLLQVWYLYEERNSSGFEFIL